MQKTYYPKTEDIKRSWYLVDAKDKILGRLAAKAASILKGKHKPIYSPHIDTGDGVIVINASLVKVTGRKLSQKVYRRYSGYPGGLREVRLEDMLAKRPTTVIKLAITRMLPGGHLGEKMARKLRVYADDKYVEQGQKPKVLNI
jgi:large subunit ribosomal protein L13